MALGGDGEYLVATARRCPGTVGAMLLDWSELGLKAGNRWERLPHVARRGMHVSCG